jgi:hypothetical protein
LHEMSAKSAMTVTDREANQNFHGTFIELHHNFNSSFTPGKR